MAAPSGVAGRGRGILPERRVPEARRSDGSGAGREDDAAVAAETEAGVVRDLPRMAVEVAEDAGVTAVERLGRFAGDRSAAPARVLDRVVDLLSRADVVRKRDAAPACAVVGDSRVCGQLRPLPQRDDDAVRLVERRILNLERRRPAERTVKRLCPFVVGDAERDQGDALLHPDRTYLVVGFG